MKSLSTQPNFNRLTPGPKRFYLPSPHHPKLPLGELCDPAVQPMRLP